jgi:hypothetical protein
MQTRPSAGRSQQTAAVLPGVQPSRLPSPQGRTCANARRRRARMKRDSLDRFWSHVVVLPTGCWLWTGSAHPERYGLFYFDKNRRVFAHKWAYMALIGEYPQGLHLDHLCRVRPCVNPAHLEPVTPAINNKRSNSPTSRNLRKTHCVRGHPLSGDNLYIAHRGNRECTLCKRALNCGYRARRAAKKDAMAGKDATWLT